MAKEGYSSIAALEIAGESSPHIMEKHGNNDIYTLRDGSKALVKFSKYFDNNHAYWYGITPGQIALFKKESIKYYFFITGYVGVIKVPIALLQPYLATCNTSQTKKHPERIRHYHVLIRYTEGKVLLHNGPDVTDYFYCDDSSDRILEAEIQSQTISDIIRNAKAFTDVPEAYVMVDGLKKVRRESRAQKYRIAYIEDFACQVCGFKEGYMDKSGQIKYIYEVDHIKDKALGYGESINNLWVLCPNCHAKKTRGIIRVDMEKKKIFERGKEIKFNDHHLFAQE